MAGDSPPWWPCCAWVPRPWCSCPGGLAARATEVCYCPGARGVHVESCKGYEIVKTWREQKDRPEYAEWDARVQKVMVG